LGSLTIRERREQTKLKSSGQMHVSGSSLFRTATDRVRA
jgi:hypothetical protein